MAWTPEGRRLVTGASSGEFTLWNGLTFNFETILQVSYVFQSFYDNLNFCVINIVSLFIGTLHVFANCLGTFVLDKQ